MYRCGNKVEIGDCVTLNVSVMVQEMKVLDGSTGIVLEINREWSSSNKPLITISLGDGSIQQFPASWCTLCQRN